MSNRKALLIGSLPFDNEEAAMTHLLEALGPHLFCLPDGEIGEKTPLYPRGKRQAWVMTVINACSEDTANWRVIREPVRDENGFPVDYDKVQRLSPKRPPGEMYRHLRLGYDDFFRSSYPIFQRLRAERGLTDLKFQVGVPTGLGITFSMMSQLTALRYAEAFNRRLADEINEVVAAAGDDAIVQIEVPGELAMAYMLPNFLVGLPVASVLGVVKKINPRARFGIHICLGDLNNKALVQAKTLNKLAHFSNELMAQWPTTHQLAYVHYPLAEAAEPPPLDPAYYAPLRRIRLPQGVRFVAGFVHEKRALAEHTQLLKILDDVRGEAVDVACSCGLGRRPTEIAKKLIELTRQVVVL